MYRPHLIDPASHQTGRQSSDMTVKGILSLTTMTGEQREAIPGLIHETRPAHKVRAPGLPQEGKQDPPLMAVHTENKKNVGVIGMRHMRGTKF